MKTYKLNTLGVMIDMSRNSVMSVEALKRYLILLKKAGYNCVMLYTEDTYEVDGEPYFGYMRGRYTKAEMKEIDAYAKELGIEVIPCMQTLAHLNATVRWNQFPVDYADILLVDDERTYEFIDHMFATLSECFESRKIHIGMDEAHMLGRGKHLDRYGYEKVNTIMRRHLDRVCEIASKYNYEPMIWSDMYFRGWNNDKYYAPKQKMPKEYIEAMPKNVIPVYWDYYSNDEQRYDDMFYNHKQLSDKTWFAGGIWSWSGHIPQNEFSLHTMIPALNSCHRNKIRDIFFTMWGDDGGECSHFAQLPALIYLAEYAKGNTDEAKIKAKFKRITGMEYDDFVYIDNPNNLDGRGDHRKNPSKYMLLADYFNDYLDYTVSLGMGAKYEEYAENLHKIAKKSRTYGYLFDTAAKLCDVLAIKYELGLKTRLAYEAGNKTELERLANEDYAKLEKELKAFHATYQKQWHKENKPHGFDVQDLRLGGIIQRTASCRRRLLDYVAGKVERIEELDEVLLPYGGKEKGETISFNRTALIATTNVYGR